MKASDKAAAVMYGAITDQMDRLNLQGLGLAALPPVPPGLRNLRHLNLSNNRLVSWLVDAWSLDQLATVDIGGNHLRELPAAIADASQLQVLDASENRLTRLPLGLAACSELRELRLYGNELMEAEPVGKLFRLTVLDLSGNRLRSMPDLRGLTELRELDLSGNLLQSLPEGLDHATALQRLDVSDNPFMSIAGFEKLPELKELVVDAYLLARMPAGFENRQGLMVISPLEKLRETLAPSPTPNARLRDEVRAAIAAYTTGGPEDDKQYFDYPPYVFDFFLAIGGVTGALRIVDLYYKRFHACCTATIKFPNSEVVELRNLTRKAAIALVNGRREALEADDLLLDMREAGDAHELQRKTQLIVEAVSCLPKAALVPKASTQQTIQFVNYHFHDAVGAVAFELIKEKHMGDKISISEVHGSIINFKSVLSSVQQTVKQASHLDTDVQKHWTELLERLSAVLAAAPAEQREDAEAIAEAAAELVAKGMKDAPNSKSISATATGLMEAAKGIAAVVPVTMEIVRSVTDFVAGK